jgi:hypothetical protein
MSRVNFSATVNVELNGENHRIWLDCWGNYHEGFAGDRMNPPEEATIEDVEWTVDCRDGAPDEVDLDPLIEPHVGDIVAQGLGADYD